MAGHRNKCDRERLLLAPIRPLMKGLLLVAERFIQRTVAEEDNQRERDKNRRRNQDGFLRAEHHFSSESSAFMNSLKVRRVVYHVAANQRQILRALRKELSVIRSPSNPYV